MNVVDVAVKALLVAYYSVATTDYIEQYVPEAYPALCAEPTGFSAEPRMVNASKSRNSFDCTYYLIDLYASKTTEAFQTTVEAAVAALIASRSLNSTALDFSIAVQYKNMLPVNANESDIQAEEHIAKITITGTIL